MSRTPSTEVDADALLGDAEQAVRSRDWHRAEALYARACHLDPGNPAAALNWSTALVTTRRVDEAMDLLQGLRSRSSLQAIRSNLLFASLYTDSISDHERARLHLEIGAEWGESGWRSLPSLDTGERMRIGYLSAHFRLDPEIFLTLPVLEQHDRDLFEIFCYSLMPERDEWTERVTRSADHFRCVAALSDDEAVKLIRADRLHVLVDGTVHFGGGRAGILARRVAPVQVTCASYPATSGVRTMDFRFADVHTDPVDTAPDLYCESLVYLECGACSYGPPALRDSGPRPPGQRGGVTFGVFSRPAKITDAFLDACAAILRETPGSRVLFHHVFNGNGVVSSDYQQPIRRRFAAAGVSGDRLEFVGGLPLEEHFEVVARADIALDAHPFAGKTTTCEPLWMGIPTITMVGKAHLSRVGLSLLHQVGLQDWAAFSWEEFVSLGVRKAKSRDELRHLRETLRGRMERSCLTNARVHARSWEAAYQLMWRTVQSCSD